MPVTAGCWLSAHADASDPSDDPSPREPVRRLEQIIAEHTGQPLAKVASDLERDSYMSSQEAVAYGVIDRVISHR